MSVLSRKTFKERRFVIVAGSVMLLFLVSFIYVFIRVHLTFAKLVSLVHIKRSKSSESLSGCTIPPLKGNNRCLKEMKILNNTWSWDPCYADWGVDGSDCSIFKFLSEIKGVCPSPIENTDSVEKRSKEKLHVRKDFNALYDAFDDKYAWIERRIKRMEKNWIEVGRKLSTKPYFQYWSKKKVVIYPGIVVEKTNTDFTNGAFTGGPLGELVQWSDLIASLYVIGHSVILMHSTNDVIKTFEHHDKSMQSKNCPVKKKFELFYTDLAGMGELEVLSTRRFNILQHYSCNIRVLDCFGTEPAYNSPKYVIRKSTITGWGSWNLNPKQISTMFPHTPDNTFLGFVIEDVGTDLPRNNTKIHMALVYGKDNHYWQGKHDYLKAIHGLIPLYATSRKKDYNNLSNIPKFVHNYGPLSAKEFHQLLQSAKIFVGLGFPIEGPAALEAIARGTVFINPVFKRNSAIKKEADEYFEDKPTSRRLESQNPYAQKFIGPPLVRMVSMGKIDEVKATVLDVIDNPPSKGYLPYEFTSSGMLERVGFITEWHEFCFKRKNWPPVSALQIVISDSVSTCTNTCAKKGLLCEPHFFPDVNQRTTFLSLKIDCDSYVTPQGKQEEIDYPAFSSNSTCYLQGNPKLFSCAGRYTNLRRVCPCRDYIRGQMSMCKECYRT